MRVVARPVAAMLSAFERVRREGNRQKIKKPTLRNSGNLNIQSRSGFGTEAL